MTEKTDPEPPESWLDEWYLWHHGKAAPKRLNLGEYWRREREIAEKARAGIATIEDYMLLGYTEAGARWMLEPDPEPPESWLDEWYLWHHGKAASKRLTEADFPTFPPFSVDNQATAYEWMMVWDDREPYAPWFGVDGENPDDADRRWDLMLIFAEEVILNLAHDIKAGAVPLVKRAHRRLRGGERELDITRCVIGKETMLDFAERIGGYGSKFAELLAARETDPKRRQTKRRYPTPEEINTWMRNNVKKNDKRDPTIKQCCAETGARWRDALAGYLRLPSELRRKRGHPSGV